MIDIILLILGIILGLMIGLTYRVIDAAKIIKKTIEEDFTSKKRVLDGYRELLKCDGFSISELENKLQRLYVISFDCSSMVLRYEKKDKDIAYELSCDCEKLIDDFMNELNRRKGA